MYNNRIKRGEGDVSELAHVFVNMAYLETQVKVDDAV